MPVVKPALARLLAIILAALVVVSGATIGFAMPANADEPEGPQLSVSVTDDLDPMGTEITITGTSYDATALAPSYYGLPEGAKAGFYVQVGYLDATWRPSEGAKSANRSNAYSRWVQGINTEEPYLIWTDNGDGTADFEWTLTIDKLTLNEKARAGAQLAVFTTGAGVTQADNEIAIPISFSTEQVLNVSVTDDLDPAGAEITITGYNYDSTSLAPSYYGLPEGAKAGFYVQVGYLDATWRPSEGAKSANRSNAYSRWVQGINAEEPYLMWSQNAANGGDLADFTWTLTIDKLTLNEKARAGAQLAVFTTGAGTTQAANEIAIPISFSTDPILNVSVTDDLDPAGAELTITGYNYDSSSLAPSYYGLPEGAKAGFYVQVGYLDATWRPSEGAKSANRSNAYSRWVQGINADEPYLKWSQNAANGGDLADFTWTVTIDKDTVDKKRLDGAQFAAFTVGAGSAPQATNELAIPLSWGEGTLTTAAPTVGGDVHYLGTAKAVTDGWTNGTAFTYQWLADGAEIPGATAGSYRISSAALIGKKLSVRVTGSKSGWASATKTSAAKTVAAAPLTPSGGASSDAALTWGVKESWRSYISSGGTVTFTGDAAQTSGAGTYTWSPGDGSYDGGTGTAAASFVGSVTFSYPTHYLNVVVADPSIEYVQGQGGTLSAVVGGTEVVFATLGDGGIDPVITDGVAEFAGIPAILTEEAAEAFIGYYAAGTELDPITLRVPVSEDGGPTPTGTPTPTPTKTPTPAPTKTPTPTPTPTASPAEPGAGWLGWGVRSSFRSYIVGPIAHGSISLSGGASARGSQYVFPQSGGNFDEKTGLGTAQYRGSVHFYGHGGELSFSFSDLAVTVDSPSSARLSIAWGDGRIDIATLALDAGLREVDSSGAIHYSLVPATLTGNGSTAFRGFYGAGERLDPIDFVIGSAGSDVDGPYVVVAASETPETREPAAEPPATTGLTLAPGTTPVAGGRVTVQADGFEPGETGIIVVIYSKPVLLGTIDADESGAATWTGALPVNLTGKHTLTFQGSVARGIELDIAAADQAGCTVESAELEWGFKESFRAYISGTIANGEWQVLDGATYETPTFGWTGGGTFDAEGSNASASPLADLSFQGGIRFVGHGGVLDTTVSDPRLVITEEGASLLLDVVGETQSGVAVDAAEVPFADLDLSTAEITSDGDVITIAGIGATLTEQGSAAFGTYPAGDPLDALTVRVTLPASCDTVVLPTAEPQPTQAPVQPDSGEGLPLWAIIVMVVLGVVVVGAIVVIVMLLRKRTA